jgi:hypothetical protein
MENPDYVFMSRGEHINKPLNRTIINFKNETRKKFNWTFFHSSDYLNESQHCFVVFNIPKYINGTKFVEINQLLGVIFLDKIFGDHYLTVLERSPHYQFLKGDKQHYLKYLKIDKGHSEEKFNELIKKLSNKQTLLSKINDIQVFLSYSNKHKKYIIKDGFHRSSLYKFHNIGYIKCKMVDDNLFENASHIHDHYYDLAMTAKKLNENNIRYTVVRGFNKLPLTPDTDLDIICHPEDVDKMKNIMAQRMILQPNSIKRINMNGTFVNYVSYMTTGIKDTRINNKHFHIDIYDNVFFFYKTNINLPSILNILFKKENQIKFLGLINIPTPEFEYFLLLLRIGFDLGWLKPKHKNRLLEIIPKVQNKNNLFSVLNDVQKKHLSACIKKHSVPIVNNYPSL